MDSAEFLRNELKRQDADRYLLSLFAPVSVRPALWALYCLDYDIARTREMVTDTNLGLIRLQWWRDEIGKMYVNGTHPQIPALSILGPWARDKNIPQDWFQALLYAREFDLQDVAPANWMGLCNYADFISTPVSKIALKLVGGAADETELKHISRDFAMQRLIRSVPDMLSRRQCFLPEDMLSDLGLSSQKIIDFNHKAEIVQVVKRLSGLITMYEKPQSVFLKRMQRMTFIYLKHLEKQSFDVFSPKMQVPPIFLALRLAMVH